MKPAAPLHMGEMNCMYLYLKWVRMRYNSCSGITNEQKVRDNIFNNRFQLNITTYFVNEMHKVSLQNWYVVRTNVSLKVGHLLNPDTHIQTFSIGVAPWIS